MEKPIIQRPSPKKVALFRIRATICSIMLAFIIGGIFVFSYVLGVFILLLAFIAYILLFTLYAPLLYENSCYKIATQSITIEKGVFFHRQYTLLIKNIEYTKAITTPISRKMNIVSVAIYTKGAKVIINDIPSIPKELE
ncbi:MAG TPA: PH domain-containing protein [Clostridiales bacterium]|nr:PH domain-containing protein [Clostridiales bacterium]